MEWIASVTKTKILIDNGSCVLIPKGKKTPVINIYIHTILNTNKYDILASLLFDCRHTVFSHE